MLMYLNTTPDNDILIKSYLKKTSTTELENLILAFKDNYKFFIRNKQEELIGQAGIDRYHPLITNTRESICRCGAIVETKVLDPCPHICWDLLDFNKYELINECCAQMLESGTLTIMEAKFILWSFKENGEYRLNFYNFYFNKV